MSSDNLRQLPPVNVEVGSLHGIAANHEQGIGLQYGSEEQTIKTLQNYVSDLNSRANLSSDPASFRQNIVQYDQSLAQKDQTLPDLEITNSQLVLTDQVQQAIHKAYK
jgi:hypothetical protein